MVGLHSLRPYLSCSCEAATVQAGRCLGSSSSGGCGCDWGVAVEAGWPPPAAAAGGCCRAAMSSAGVAALTPSQAADHRVVQREAAASTHRRGPADQQGLWSSWLDGSQPGEGSPLQVCGWPGEAAVHTCRAATCGRDGAALRVTSCRSHNQLLMGSDRWQHEEHLVQHPRQSRAGTHH